MDPEVIGALTRNYVAFSAKAFPELLVPLLAEQGVMINPERPLVIYESMSIELQRVDMKDLELAQGGAEAEVNGKRGEARLAFVFKSADKVVGKGVKRMLLSGLQPYDEARSRSLVEHYFARKAAYAAR